VRESPIARVPASWLTVNTRTGSKLYVLWSARLIALAGVEYTAVDTLQGDALREEAQPLTVLLRQPDHLGSLLAICANGTAKFLNDLQKRAYSATVSITSDLQRAVHMRSWETGGNASTRPT
jgi:hypothetical protein